MGYRYGFSVIPYRFFRHQSSGAFAEAIIDRPNAPLDLTLGHSTIPSPSLWKPYGGGGITWDKNPNRILSVCRAFADHLRKMGLYLRKMVLSVRSGLVY